MEIISLNRGAIRSALTVLRRGGVVVYPTETAYGLGCDATNAHAVKKIFQIKGRPAKKPLPLIVASRAMAERYVTLSPTLDQLAKKYWPGALTVVAPLRTRNETRELSNWETIVTSGTGMLGFRVSAFLFAQALTRGLQRPIVATSANRAGGGECFTLLDVLRQFDARYLPDLCIDGGKLLQRKPSTVVTERDGKIVVLRKGPIVIPHPDAGSRKMAVDPPPWRGMTVIV